MAIATKQADVHFSVSTRPLSTAGVKPAVAIGTPSSDDSVHAKVYSNLDDISGDFQEDSGAYKTAEAIFAADNYNAPVEIIQYPNKVSATPAETSAQINFADGIQQAFYEHLNDGWDYVVLNNDSDYDSAYNLATLLYDNQRGFLVYQVGEMDALTNTADKIKSYESNKDGKLGNTYLVYVHDSSNHVAAQIAGYIAANSPVDLQQIGNQSNFVPEDLGTGDLKTILNENASIVVNKADDYMMLSGKAVAGNYADQFIKMRHSIDAIQYGLQRKHNSQGNPKFDDDTIREYRETVLAIGNNLLSAGYLDTAPKVYTTSRANIPDNEIASRQYNHLTVELSIANTIDTINGKFNITF